MSLYPLRFEPIFRQYLWGGRRLETVLGKQLGAGNDFAESWELVDHGEDQSVVRFGALAGTTLQQLVARHGRELLGRHHPLRQFPLLFKFLDANRDLSVQVHPNDEQGSRLVPPDLGKTEAWYILLAEPGSKIYAGLKQDVDRDALVAAISEGTTANCLHQFEPRAGDCIFIPAGTVHALGAGLVVAEIQQASDTTFRLFDWNRVGHDGKARELHIEQALEVIDFQAGPVAPQTSVATSDKEISRLVACDKFVMDRWSFQGSKVLHAHNQCHLLVALAGNVNVANDPAEQALVPGETLLVPASAGDLLITAEEPAVLLSIALP